MDGIAKAGARDLAQKSKHDSRSHKRQRQADREPAEQTLGQLPRFFTIGREEHLNITRSLKTYLSGYIGGDPTAGYWVTKLSKEWAATFGVTHTVPCNSATSGLYAACLAADIGPGDLVLCPDYTMSATATCAMMLGANVRLVDIHPEFFTMDISDLERWGRPKAIIVCNLFGCPADLKKLRELCDLRGIVLIEDCAQAPFAALNGQYCGTIGHIGVFSFNVHKHLQCGEGGIIVTSDDELAHRLHCAINHGELNPRPLMGLNLRMTEPIAAIACAQLAKGPKIVQERINLAHHITSLFDGIDFIHPPRKPPGAEHVYYMWAGKVEGDHRQKFVRALRKRGLPFREGYSIPLHRLFVHNDWEPNFPVTCSLEDRELFTFEICAYDPKPEHLRTMRQIIVDEANKI